MCPLGRAGSSPALGTTPTRVAKLVDAQSSEGCALGRAGSNPVPGTQKGFFIAKGVFFVGVNPLLAILFDLKFHHTALHAV